MNYSRRSIVFIVTWCLQKRRTSALVVDSTKSKQSLPQSINDSTKQFLLNTVSLVSNKLDRVAAILFGSLPRLPSSRNPAIFIS